MTTYKFRHRGMTFGPYTLADVARLAPSSNAARAAAEGETLENTEIRDTEGRSVFEGDRVSVEVEHHAGTQRWVTGTVVWTGTVWGCLPDAGQGFVEGGRFGPLSNYRCTLIEG